MSDIVPIVCPHCRVVNRVPGERLHEHPTCGRCRDRLFVGAPVELDEAGFERFLTRNGPPMVVDFWAPWCGPCLQMAPAFAEAAATLEPRVRFVKVDTERSPALAARHRIRSIPTLALFAEGREIDRQAGAMSVVQMRTWLGQTLPLAL